MTNKLEELTHECMQKIEGNCDKYCNPDMYDDCSNYQKAVRTQIPLRQGTGALYYLVPYVKGMRS